MSQKTLNLCLERYNFVKFGETTKSSHTVLCINNANNVNSDKYRLTPTAIAGKHGDGYVFTLNYDFDRPLFTIVQKSYTLDGTSGNIVFEGIDPISKGGSKYLRKVTVSPVKLSDGSYLLEVTKDEYLRIGTTGAALGDEDLESLNEKIVTMGGIEKSVETVGGKQVLKLDAGGPSGAKEIVYFDIDPSDPPSGIYEAIGEALSNNKIPVIKIDNAVYFYTATGTDKYVFVGGYTKDAVGYTEIEVSDDDSVTSKPVDDKVFNMYMLYRTDPASPGDPPGTGDQPGAGYWICDENKHVITKTELMAAHANCRYFVLNNDIEPDSNTRKYFASVTVISNSNIRILFSMIQTDDGSAAEFTEKLVMADSEGRLYILRSYEIYLAGTNNAVLVSEPQDFTAEEQTQGRNNIGAASASDVTSLQSQVSSLSDVSAYTVKGEATVAQLNAGPSGIQAGWAYQLTDSGTLTDGSLAVVAGDTVAWDGTKWFPLVKSNYYATKTYSQNVAHSIAPEFDPTKPNDAGGYAYYSGTPVMYGGSCYVFTSNKKSGAWDFGVVEKKPLSEAIQLEGVGEAVNEWLDEHPEATTTVEDGSLNEPKFTDTLKKKTIKDYVTPEMFGAKGDGETDDTDALQAAINSGKMVVLVADYAITESIVIPTKCRIQGYGNPVIRAKANLEIVLNLNGRNITIKDVSVVCTGYNVTYGIYCPNESTRFLFEKVYIQHVVYGFFMRSYLTKLIGCEVYDFVENGFTFVGTSSTPYSSNTSLFIANCYARRSSDNRGKIGFSLTDVIYSSLISCAADHCEVAYDLNRCQSVSLVSCGCENFNGSAVAIHELSRGINISSLFAGYNNAHSIIRCYGTCYLTVTNSYINGSGTLDYYFYDGGGRVVAELPDLWRGRPMRINRISTVSFPNKITYSPDTVPTDVYDGDMYTSDGSLFFAEKRTDEYGFYWRELERAGRFLSTGFPGTSRVVVALCEIGISGGGASWSSGELIFNKNNGDVDVLTKINFYFQRKGTSTDARYTLFGTSNEINGPVVLDGTEAIGDFAGYRPVTFTYAGKSYAGIEFYCGNIANPHIYLKAIERGFTVFRVEWYNQSTHTAINQAIADSIQTLTTPKQMLIDRAKRDSFGNLIKAPANYPSTGTYTLKIINGVVQWVSDS